MLSLGRAADLSVSPSETRLGVWLCALISAHAMCCALGFIMRFKFPRGTPNTLAGICTIFRYRVSQDLCAEGRWEKAFL